MIDEAVSKLATYALRTDLIQKNKYTWAVNYPHRPASGVYKRTGDGRMAFLQFLKQL